MLSKNIGVKRLQNTDPITLEMYLIWLLKSQRTHKNIEECAKNYTDPRILSKLGQ